MHTSAADEEANGHLVACYAIGWRITEAALEEYPHLPFTAEEDDTGVIVAFNSEAEDVTYSLMISADVRTLAISRQNGKRTVHRPEKRKNWARAAAPISPARNRYNSPRQKILCGALWRWYNNRW